MLWCYEFLQGTKHCPMGTQCRLNKHLRCRHTSNYRPRSLAKQGDNALGSVCPSVHASALSLLNRLNYDLDFVQRRIITLKFKTKMKRAEKSHYKSEVFVCVSTNRADAVDRLLIMREAAWRPHLASASYFFVWVDFFCISFRMV